jgi:hypothetical protein
VLRDLRETPDQAVLKAQQELRVPLATMVRLVLKVIPALQGLQERREPQDLSGLPDQRERTV